MFEFLTKFGRKWGERSVATTTTSRDFGELLRDRHHLGATLKAKRQRWQKKWGGRERCFRCIIGDYAAPDVVVVILTTFTNNTNNTSERNLSVLFRSKARSEWTGVFIRIGGEEINPKSIEERELSRRVRRASDWLERGEDVIDALRLWNGFGRKNVQIGDEEFTIAKVMGVLPFADRFPQLARRRKNPYS